jgi:hypothetical protein
MQVVTVATHSDGYLDALRTGCERMQLPIHFLGMGEDWLGFGWRIKKLKEHIDGLPAETIVICVDAFDVVPITRSAEDLKSKYLQFKKPIVFGVDGEADNPIHQWGHDVIFGTHRGVTLNGGTYMGRADKLRTLFTIWMSGEIKDEVDDQKILNKAFRVHDAWFHENVGLDRDGLIFYNNLCGLMDKNAIGRSLYVPGFSHSPMFVHGAGNCNMDEMVETLDLPPGRKRDRILFLWKALGMYVPMVFGV